MMERALKERIIGAAVLVLFVVLVVPIFLDGPPGENDIVSETVLLPGQESQKTQTVVLERNRTEPVPAASAKPEPIVTPPAQAPAKSGDTEGRARAESAGRRGEESRTCAGDEAARVKARARGPQGTCGIDDRHVGRPAR